MKIAILGCGSIGRRHLRNLVTLGQTDLLAFDPQSEAREQVLAETGVRVCATTAEVWREAPDAALITSPSNLHVPLALEAAQHGCDLFIEKPLSSTLDGLDELQSEVQSRELITMVGCNMRFHPGPAAVKALLDQAEIGAVLSARIQSGSYLPRWRPQSDYRQSYSASTEWGGAILDCIHEIDLALWYFGPASLLAAVRLPAQSLGLETDGLAEMLLRHEAGVLSSVHLNFVQRDSRRGCQIIGTTGTIYWDFSERVVKIFGEDGALSEAISEPPGWDANQMYLDEVKHFLQAVKTRQPTMNPVAGGVAALKIALAARTQ